VIDGLVLENCYEAYNNHVIPELILYAAFAVNAEYLAEFPKKYKNPTCDTVTKVKDLLEWVEQGISSRNYPKGVGTSATGFPVFKQEHLFGSGAEMDNGITETFINKWFGDWVDWAKSVRGFRDQTFIKYSGSRSSDNLHANRMTFHKGAKAPEGAVWHHHEVVSVMQLVKKDCHAGTGMQHSGGVLMYEILTNTTYKGNEQ